MHRESWVENPSRKDKHSQQSKFEQEARSEDQQHQSRSFAYPRVCQVSRTKNFISAARNDRNQEQNPSSLGVVLQIQTRADVKILPCAAQVTLVQYGDLSDNGLRVWNVDLDKRTRRNDTFVSTQKAPAHHKNKKKVLKKKTTSNLKIKKATLKKKKAKRTPKTVHKKEAAQTPIATKKTTSPLPKTLKKRSTQLNLNKKTGLIT